MPSFIGTGADQVPVNSMLGSLAYQNADDVKLGNITYSGNLTGGSGVVNIGSGQIYKTADGKLGLNTTNPLSLLHLNQGATGEGLRFERTGYDVMDIELSENGLRIRNETDGRTDFLLDGAGNLGFGVTPSSWAASWKGLDLQGGSIASGTATELRLYSNSYYNGTNTLYRNAGFATAYQQSGGQHNWFVAPSGSAGGTVTFSTAMSLDATSLSLNGTGATKLQEGTTAQRPASPQEGMIRKNSSTGRIEAYYGGSWTTLGRSGAYLEKTLASGYLNGLSEIAGGSISSTADEIIVSFHDVKTSGTTPTYLELSTFNTTSGLVNVSYFCTRVSGSPTPTLQSYSDGMSTGGTKAINLTNWASANDEYSGEIRFSRTVSDYAANYDTWSFSGELHCLGSGSTRSNISISGKFIVSNLASFKFDYIKVKNSTAFTGGRVMIAETKDFSNRT